jgi:hypothetical protein
MMKVFLPVWGNVHINLFKDALATSLKWPGNKRAVKGAEWIILTYGEFNEKAIKEIILSIDETARIDFQICPDLMCAGADKGPLLFNTLLYTIEKCLKDKETLLMATPDYIYGDGTIERMKKVAGDKHAVSFAHMRVKKKALSLLDNYETNASLTSLGFMHPHKTWTDSELTHSPGITFWGGISWQWIDYGLAAVTHYLPAPFMVNFVESDLGFFKAKHEFPNDKLTFALWDHLFPTKLIQEGRLRYIGSSDAACMIEVTEDDANIPPVNPEGKTNADGYVKEQMLQNLILKQFVSVFRGEP